MPRHPRSSTAAVILASMLGACGGAPGAADGQLHESKADYADAAEWPTTGPGQVDLANFEPFRAVYERHYRDMNGEHRQDRVVVTAERVAWGSEGAVMVTLTDTGSPDYDDTTARIQVRYFAETDGRLLFQIAPSPGTANDVTVVRIDDGDMKATAVESLTGAVNFREMAPPDGPGWGVPALWIAASIRPEDGDRIRVAPVYAMATSGVFADPPMRAVRRESVDGPDGPTEAFVIEYPSGMQSPRMMRTWLVDRPPYLLRRQPYDAVTGEEPLIGTMRLVSFQRLDG